MRAAPRLSARSAVWLVVANMIGTGVFTSLGFQVAAVPSAFPALLVWVVGGVVALAGALVYGELGAALPRSGGEYAILRRTLHPAAGFAAGCVSATVGFAAPTALAAIALATYLKVVLPALPTVLFASGVVVAFGVVHAFPVRIGTRVTDWLTVLKVVLVAGFCLLGLLVPGEPQPVAPRAGDAALLFSPGFAVSLVFVSYAYSGWNAATYVVGDLKRPERLVRVLVGGTALVVVLYALVNLVILRAVPLAELSGNIEVGALAAGRLLGPTGERAMAAAIAVVLASTVSAMMFLGPRIIREMGADSRLLRPFSRRSAGGVPHRALALQTAVALALLLSGTFDQVLVYAGFALNVMTAVTVAGVFRLRRGRVPGAVRGRFRTPLHPLAPALFLAASGWTLGYAYFERPVESSLGLATASAGALIWFFDRRGRTRSDLVGDGGGGPSAKIPPS